MTPLSQLPALIIVFTCSVHQLDAVGCIGKSAGDTDCDSNCNLALICKDSGVWSSVIDCLTFNQVCYGGQCKATEDFCTKSPQEMNCNSASGLYPYPSDCTTYFECTPGQVQGEPKKCVASGFDPVARDCSLTLTNGVCPTSSVSSCTYNYQQIAIPGTGCEYYQCILSANGFQLNLIECPIGSRYSARTGTCVEVEIDECNVCPSGVPGPRWNGATNCSYIWCYSQTEFVVRHCAQGYHFELTQGQCVHGACTRRESLLSYFKQIL